MVIMKLWTILILIYQSFRVITAQDLWVVTENGRIQQQLDSPFVLRRPYDLLAFLEQDVRWTEMKTINDDLLTRKTVIDDKWSGLESASDLISRVYAQVEDCLFADKLLTEMDLFESFGENGTDREGLNGIVLNDNESVQHSVPDCAKLLDLDFSVFAYEHLRTMVNRSSISIKPEMLEYLMPVGSVERFGDGIAIGLSTNSSSWFHYNLALLYWRIKGDAFNAVECGRRALFLVPRLYRDIPLINLAGIFHQSRSSSDALILLHAALDHSPHRPEIYRFLGDVYASVSEYSKSIIFYDGALELQPSWPAVKNKRHAVLCHKRLESELMDLHETLQGILTDLHDYHGRQQQWLRLQDKLLFEKVPFSVQLSRYNSDKLNTLVSSGHRGQRCVRRGTDDSTITCDFMDGGGYASADFQVDATENLQRLLLNVESETRKISQQIFLGDKDGTKPDEGVEVKRKVMPPLLHEKYPTSFSSSTNQYYDETDWPSKEMCVEWDLAISEQDNLDLPVFLPPENKGYQVEKMLADYLGLPRGAEHELPWYPPVCEYPDKKEGMTLLPNLLKKLENNPLQESEYLRDILRRYVNDGKAEEAEIGQRIVAAMHKKTGPEWVLATLASLYWRVRTNSVKAFDCLEVAFRTVPKESADTVLVSYASLLQHHGLIEDAIKLATVAYKTNYAEPSTNFLLALLHFPKNNPIMAMYHMKNVLRADSGYYDGLAEKLLKTWACRIKLGGVSEVKTKGKGNKERQSFSGEGVVCSANGDQCKTATIQCFRGDGNEDAVDSGKNSKPTTTPTVSGPSCRHKVTKGRANGGSSVISTLMTHEDGSGGLEPDQSQLESMSESSQETLHMRISLDENENGLDDSEGEATLHVFDKSGTYPLSPQSCRQMRDVDWSQYASMWQSFASRNVDISRFMKPIPKSSRESRPHCADNVAPSSHTFDYLATMILRRQLPDVPESGLGEWLGLMAGDRRAPVHDVAAKIAVALKENTTSWILATAAALYWRIVGNTMEAVNCLRQALTHVPSDMKDIPLTSLANVLHRVGFPSDALEVALAALNSRLNFVVNHFTVGNIYASMGDLEKAISFYRSALAVDPNFEPARSRLQIVLCKLLFDESGPVKESGFFSGM